MNDNYFMLGGKKIPMDEGTLRSLKKMYIKPYVPVVRVASFECNTPHDRIIIRLSKPAKELFSGLESDVVVIDSCGNVANHWLASDEFDNDKPREVYSNIQTLIEGNLP